MQGPNWTFSRKRESTCTFDISLLLLHLLSFDGFKRFMTQLSLSFYTKVKQSKIKQSFDRLDWPLSCHSLDCVFKYFKILIKVPFGSTLNNVFLCASCTNQLHHNFPLPIIWSYQVYGLMITTLWAFNCDSGHRWIKNHSTVNFYLFIS